MRVETGGGGEVARELRSRAVGYEESVLCKALILTKVLPVDKRCSRTIVGMWRLVKITVIRVDTY